MSFLKQLLKTTKKNQSQEDPLEKRVHKLKKEFEAKAWAAARKGRTNVEMVVYQGATNVFDELCKVLKSEGYKVCGLEYSDHISYLIGWAHML